MGGKQQNYLVKVWLLQVVSRQLAGSLSEINNNVSDNSPVTRLLCVTCVRGQVGAGGGAVDAGCVILECGWLLVVLHDGF